MSHDDASGIISYNRDNDSVDIIWDKVGFEKNFEIVNNAMEKVTKGLRGTFVKNPTWTPALGKSVVSAHPLGGCPMGESGRTAVVNHAGQVFDGKKHIKISDGLSQLLRAPDHCVRGWRFKSQTRPQPTLQGWTLNFESTPHLGVTLKMLLPGFVFTCPKVYPPHLHPIAIML